MNPLFLTLAALAATPLLAAPLACATGTLADYVALGATGCRLGSFIVTGFEETSITGSADRIAASDIEVRPDFNANSGSLLFFFAFGTATQFLENRFLYSVSGPLTFAALDLAGATASGTGATLVTQELCAGGTYASGFCPANEFVQAVFEVDGVEELRSFTDLGSVPALTVRQSISIDAGPAGQASFAASTATFGTPEPGSLLLIAGGLTVLFGRRLALRRKATTAPGRS